MASTVVSPDLELETSIATASSAPTPKEGGGYSAENITVLEGLTAVRLRPAMYIGSTGEQGLHHLVYEVVDNSVDEALGGHATRIDVTIHVDNSITVVDDGRGIPVDDKVINGEKMPAVQVVLTMLHAGGKFDASNYKVSGGLHGVGVSCVNALSQEFDVEIWRDGYAWEQDYSKGIPISKLRKMGVSKRKGTKVHFLPDKSIFTVTEYNYDTLAQQGANHHADRRARHRHQDRRQQAAGVQVCGRHRRIHQAPQPRQAGAARQADLHGGGARRRGDGDCAAV
jgi:DNA gyrase subunit B